MYNSLLNNQSPTPTLENENYRIKSHCLIDKQDNQKNETNFKSSLEKEILIPKYNQTKSKVNEIDKYKITPSTFKSKLNNITQKSDSAFINKVAKLINDKDLYESSHEDKE